MIFRVISNQGRKLSAYGLFAATPESYAALLEDPSGSGRQFLASRDGDADALCQGADSAAADAFFERWRQYTGGDRYDSPAIRCLCYAAYEAGGLIEALPAPKTAVPGPLLWTFLPAFSLCFDDERIHLVARDTAALDQALQLLAQQPAASCSAPLGCDLSARQVTAAAHYRAAVERVRAYIAAGDLFQANIARFWQMPFDAADMAALYGRLRQVNPAPFSACVRIASDDDTEPLWLASASPERLFRMHADGAADTRPIAGTRRRDQGARDNSLRTELLLSEKERAEHIMLVDLERNDLGRVCRPGTIEVDERMVIEQYATVQHIVSNVRGVLQDGRDIVDLFRAMFPGGTITGCPKVRCMEVIHELEGSARGPYTGGLGYSAWDGSADMNILIRTFWHHRGRLCWAAGAGIVADSDPEHELIEAGHKAEGLLRAIAPGA